MIDIYFIRHGETGGNIAKRHQLELTPLTAKGRAQAENAAGFVATLNPTHLIASTRVRTLQTAQIIAEPLDIIPQTRITFVELMRPDTIYGSRHVSVRSVMYLFKWYFGYVGDSGAYGAGESYAAFRTRIVAAQKELAQLPDASRVVVVSHSVFISFFVAHLCSQKPLSFFRVAHLFLNMLRLQNGSVSQVQYNPFAPKGTCAWKLQSYNQLPK